MDRKKSKKYQRVIVMNSHPVQGGTRNMYTCIVTTLRFKINRAETFNSFCVIFADLPRSPCAAYFDLPFINLLNFTKDYKEVHKYIKDN